MSTPYPVTILDGQKEKLATLPLIRLFNLGSATRNPGKAQPHQGEVASAGIKIAFQIPAPRIYPISISALTSAHDIGVHGDHTSGEVEIVALTHEGRLLVGVGSDHTDRDLERTSISWSKQVCPNVVAPFFWPFDTVADHWDECVLESEVDGDLYQRTSVSTFLSPPDLTEVVRQRTDAPVSGTWVFSGTVASIAGKFSYGNSWTFRLIDPVFNNTIEHHYELFNLLGEVHTQYRVPLTSAQ